MRRLAAVLALFLLGALPAAAQQPPQQQKAKENANPCRDEVAAALQKLRRSSWFRMDTTMITENGPTNMVVDYVLPDRMHQKVNVIGQPLVQEVILIAQQAWSNEGEGWRVLPGNITMQLVQQMAENVLSEQSDVGNYACKGKVQIDGKDMLSYKLEEEAQKDGGDPSKNEAYRMFYVDATTGLPVRNAIVTPGREEKPIFKTSYSYPLDLKIEPPKDAKPFDAKDAAPADVPAPAPAEPKN